MSTTQEYGPTDLGSEGISTFFARHKCNDASRQESIFQGSKGLCNALPTRGTRAPLTGNGVNAGVDSGYASMNQLPALVEGLEIIEE